MRLMNSLSVRGKLALAFACMVVLITLLGGFAVLQLSRVFGQAETILVYRLPGVRDSQRMLAAVNQYRLREFRVLLTTPAELDGAIAKLGQARKAFEDASASYAEAIESEAERELFDASTQSWKKYVAESTRAIALLKDGKPDAGREQVMGPAGLKLSDDTRAALQKLSEFNDEHAKRDASVAQGIYTLSRWLIAAAVVLAVAVSTALAWLIGRAIANPLRDAVALARSVADGDLTHRPVAQGQDELAQLARALSDMVARLRSVVLDVRGGVESVTTASTQIASGNLDLSQRTEEQASNLQQTAASMEQLTSTVRQNADNARAAAQLAAGATNVAKRGGEVVGNVVRTMDAITESSKRIGDIVSVIDGIAFQTNILALNAAVEAARAGEQGRGFAVVASEVRSLAQRSATAAKEIKTLIEQSVESVGSGAQQVAEAGQTMDDIVRQSQRVNDLVDEISTASIEQSRGIDQVGSAVSQLDQVTQQNAALVEEAAAAAESMKHQALNLAHTVAVFKLDRAEPQGAVAV